MKRLLFALLLPVTAIAQKDFELKGKLQLQQQPDWVYLRYVVGDEVVLDSAVAKEGTFSFHGKLAEPVLASLFLKYVKLPHEERPKRENIQLFLEGGAMLLQSSDSLLNHTLSGSPAHDAFLRLRAASKIYTQEINRMSQAYSAAAARKDNEAMKLLEDSIEATESELKEKAYLKFVQTNPSSPVALYALKQYAGYDINPVLVEPLFAALQETVRMSPSGKKFSETLELAKKTAVGVYAMDFTQNDTLGKPVSLSSFRGKYVLVDFWASWCGPCRRENPNLVKAFQKYKDRNFTVLGVSLDRPDAKDKWLAAIHKDNLTWTQVSDLKFWDNAVAKQYGIMAIPQNFLIDPSGKIIAKGLTGEDLSRKLEEVLPR